MQVFRLGGNVGVLRLHLMSRIAVIAVLMSGATFAQSVPIDPVSGLAIPLLPKQEFYRTKDGCGIITDVRNKFHEEIRHWRWIGSCKYGLIDGPGLLVNEDPQYVTQTKEATQAQLGYIPYIRKENSVYLARTSARNGWEWLTVDSNIVAANGGRLVDGTGGSENHALVFLNYQNDQTWTTEKLHLLKNDCWTDDVYGGAANMIKFTMKGARSADVGKVIEYCKIAAKRLKSETGDRYFHNANYGFFFMVLSEKSVTEWKSNKFRSTRTLKLCPKMATLSGCEKLWQVPLAPYAAKFAQLKPQEEATYAARLADAKQRFAPLEAAWRERIRQIKGP